MSEYSNERKQRYIKTMLKPGERVWFFRLTGHMMEKARTQLVKAINKKVFQMSGKKDPWQLFRFGIERDSANAYDELAVSVFLWHRQKDGTWIKRDLGFIPRQERGHGKHNHNKAVALWLDDKLIKTVEYTVKKGSKETFTSPLVRLVHSYWKDDGSFGSVYFAVHTDYETKDLPRGVKEIENVGKPHDGKKHEGVIPTVSSNEYPDPKTVDRLISAHREFENYFTLEEDDGICVPVFMSQWDEEIEILHEYKDHETFENSLGTMQQWPWGNLTETKDLRVIAKEHGPVMAENYYKFNGIFEGPFTQQRASTVLAAIQEILMVCRRYQSQKVQADGAE